MPMTEAQIEKVYRGLPDYLDGVAIARPRGREFINYEFAFPRLVFSIISQGIPVGNYNLLTDYYDPDSGIRTEVWSQIHKARITLVLQSQDPKQLDKLLNCLAEDLASNELGINPITDFMQYRGSDPPSMVQPYIDPDNKKMVQGYSIDIFVEYIFTWKKYFDVIKEVYIEYDTRDGEDLKTQTWYNAVGNEKVNAVSFFMVDTILSVIEEPES
jgi:hypothetical protein